jgi:hypothetical protein
MPPFSAPEPRRRRENSLFQRHGTLSGAFIPNGMKYENVHMKGTTMTQIKLTRRVQVEGTSWRVETLRLSDLLFENSISVEKIV